VYILKHTQTNFAFGALEFGSCLQTTVQMQSCSWLMICASGFKMSHLAGLWVWYSSWGWLRKRLYNIHFQQILNQTQTKFSVLDDSGIAIHYSLVQSMKK